MRTIGKLRWSSMVVALLLLAPAPGRAQSQPAPGPHDHVERHGTNGSLNWTLRRFEVQGFGAPPASAVNLAQAKIMARRAAIVDAQRNLLEIIKGTRLDARSYVSNFITANDEAQTTVTGVVQGAVPTAVKEYDDGRVEVTLALGVEGRLAEVLLGPKEPPRGGGAPGPAPSSPPPAVSAPPPAPPVIYSGLVVDARGLGARPAMAPRLVSEAGQEIFGKVVVDPVWAVRHGMANYVKDVPTAQANRDRIGDRPFTVKGLKADGANKTDVVISNADAQALLGAAEHLSFLEKARVVIVVD